MSDQIKPIYERLDDVAAIQQELRALGLSADRMFVVTPDHPSEFTLRKLQGGIIPGVRSLGDSLNKIEEAMSKGATGIDFSAATKV